MTGSLVAQDTGAATAARWPLFRLLKVIIGNRL